MFGDGHRKIEAYSSIYELGVISEIRKSKKEKLQQEEEKKKEKKKKIHSDFLLLLNDT